MWNFVETTACIAKQIALIKTSLPLWGDLFESLLGKYYVDAKIHKHFT